MRVHIFQHVEFETEGTLIELITENCTISRTCFFKHYDAFPIVEVVDILIVLGGPMGVYEMKKYLWLGEEVKYIKKAIQNGTKVIGICLGAQLIVKALGGEVYKSETPEIGWYPIKKAGRSTILNGLDSDFTVMHWHGDTFNIPVGAIRLFSSECTLNQGFLYGSNTLGLQFHIEMMESGLSKIVDACSSELVETTYVQSAKEILANNHHLTNCHKNLKRLLANFLSI